LFGIALCLIESSGWLWFAKDVGDTVVADAVARSEVGVGVVVECAPPDAPGILRIRGKLVVNARMVQRVFALPLIIVGGLGGKRVPHKFCIQVARMIRRF